MSNRSYGQYCALAKSLDLVGDRWTLLVVRELLDGPKRYVDLLDGLVTMSTDMLASRLRGLEDAGLVTRRTLPPPGAVRVYELTEAGAGLEAVIDAYVGWGRHLLAERGEDEVVSPTWLVRAVRAFVRPDRPDVDLTVRYEMPE
ncbi:MAG TPA: helix-turn-helix domain-containing protein, partial [Aquihabitans sp.]|nr:helix-turn-helix domain-containing protein [Aquihabitans sp.]